MYSKVRLLCWLFVPFVPLFYSLIISFYKSTFRTSLSASFASTWNNANCVCRSLIMRFTYLVLTFKTSLDAHTTGRQWSSLIECALHMASTVSFIKVDRSPLERESEKVCDCRLFSDLRLFTLDQEIASSGIPTAVHGEFLASQECPWPNM